jgi:hypothetical protein
VISACIMGHPARGHFIRELQVELPEAELRLDRGLGRWDTGARAMQAYDPAASHHLVIQDDAILSRDLLGACELIVEHSGDRVVALYLGGARPYADRVELALERAWRLGAAFIEGPGPWWGVGVLFPVEWIDLCVEWGAAHEHIENWDLRVTTFFRRERRNCLYTVPSLVEHRPVAENPSLVPGRHSNRFARVFCGREGTGGGFDWGAGIVGMDDKLRFRHLRTGRTTTARPHSPHFERLAASKLWERVPEGESPRQLGERVA